jgi:hypothetical protein
MNNNQVNIVLEEVLIPRLFAQLLTFAPKAQSHQIFAFLEDFALKVWNEIIPSPSLL